MSGAEYLTFCARLRGLPGRRRERRIDALLDDLRAADRPRRADERVLERHAAEDPAVGRADPQPDASSCSTSRAPGSTSATTLVIRSLIQRLAAAGRIVIYSSHELEMVERVCSEVLILREGRVAAHAATARAARAGQRRVARGRVPRARVHDGRGRGRRGDRRRHRPLTAQSAQATRRRTIARATFERLPAERSDAGRHAGAGADLGGGVPRRARRCSSPPSTW